MTNLKTRITTAIATGAVLANAFVPAAFASTITVSGNGSESENTAVVTNTNDVVVNQDNVADFNNNVNVTASTGDNDANDNTGDNVSIETGDVDVEVDIVNKANKNVAHVDACCQADTSVNIEGNGSDSDNVGVVNSDNTVRVNQDNYADFDNNVYVEAETGDNDANDNTGANVNIETGDVDVAVAIANVANYNSVVIDGDDEEGADVSAMILGNGSDSDNEIVLDFDNDVLVDQDNYADFENYIEVDAETGDNDAEDNTNGEVEITTGDVDLEVDVDNMANFNHADLDNCGCIEDLTAKISGNGSDSDNLITFASEDDLRLDQDNEADFDTEVEAELETGDNDADDNTGEVDAESDPSIETGDVDAEVNVTNSGNANVLGDEADSDVDVDFTFNLGDLLDWLEARLS